MASARDELEALTDRQLLIRLVQLLEALIEEGPGGPPRQLPPPHHRPQR